jgi:uncharacterized protein (DUF58 family)
MRASWGFRPTFSPAVRFESDFPRRAWRWAARRAAAGRRPWALDGAGAARTPGAGFEFLGYRPYRPGEDLRHVDWDSYARFEVPFVRVHRREAGERWSVRLDCSASMGVGDALAGATKLQRASEVAFALALLGVTRGARVEIESGSGRFVARRRGDFAALLAFLSARRAEGSAGIPKLGAAGATHVFAIGDLFDDAPADVAPLARRPGCQVSLTRILASHELEAPPDDGAIDWIDPESGAHLEVRLGTRARERFERLVSGELDAWRTWCARHRVGFGVANLLAPFESIATAAFGR